MQYVLPEKYRMKAIIACYNDMGCLGQDRPLDLLKDCFVWPNMARDVEQHLRGCDRCLRFKVKAQSTKMKLILTSYPLVLDHMDFLTIELGKTNKDINILLMTGQFTQYAQAYITPSQMAMVVAKLCRTTS